MAASYRNMKDCFDEIDRLNRIIASQSSQIKELVEALEFIRRKLAQQRDNGEQNMGLEIIHAKAHDALARYKEESK